MPLFTYGMIAAYPGLKCDQNLLERLNSYICKVTSNDYVSSYEDLLSRLNVQPLFQTITHRRILLAQKYVTTCRYQPPGTIRGLTNPRFRLRSHARSVTVSPPTARQTNSSSLEDVAAIWNRVPANLAGLAPVTLKRTLRTQNYHDGSEPYRHMQRAIRLIQVQVTYIYWVRTTPHGVMIYCTLYLRSAK